MEDTFVTTGEVIEDYPFFLVGRKDAEGKIRLGRSIPEYCEDGHRVHIDGWGNPWVRK